jgi:hypothetical protein
MSNSLGYRANEYTIFQRPLQVPPYQFSRCAKWLVRKNKFKSYELALDYLIDLEITDPVSFRYIMSEYYRIHDYKTYYLLFNRNVNNYKTNQYEYGNEMHMDAYIPGIW